MLIAVNYHYVRPAFDAPYPGIHGVTPEALASQLALLASAGELVSAEQVRAAVAGRTPLPERAILVTFDDGLREQYDYALPVVRRLGGDAICFVNTAPIATGTISPVHKLHLTRAHVPPDVLPRLVERHARRLGLEGKLHAAGPQAELQYPYDPPEAAHLKYALNFVLTPAESARLVGRCFDEVFEGREREMSAALYMDVEQLRSLAVLGALGTHGHEHLPLGLLSRSAARAAIARSVACLHDWTGQRPVALSYPYGSADACAPWVGRLAARCGIAYAFTMERAANHDLAQPLQLARFDCNDLPGGRHARFTIETMFAEAPHRTWFRHARPGRAHAH